MLKKSKLYSKIIVILLVLVCKSALAQKFQLEYNTSQWLNSTRDSVTKRRPKEIGSGIHEEVSNEKAYHIITHRFYRFFLWP